MPLASITANWLAGWGQNTGTQTPVPTHQEFKWGRSFIDNDLVVMGRAYGVSKSVGAVLDGAIVPSQRRLDEERLLFLLLP